MQFTVYWLISEDFRKTYVGFTDNINRRIKEHGDKRVSTTKNFGKFRCFRLEEVEDVVSAITREKYWKSAAGRRKLSKYFDKIKNK